MKRIARKFNVLVFFLSPHWKSLPNCIGHGVEQYLNVGGRGDGQMCFCADVPDRRVSAWVLWKLAQEIWVGSHAREKDLGQVEGEV